MFAETISTVPTWSWLAAVVTAALVPPALLVCWWHDLRPSRRLLLVVAGAFVVLWAACAIIDGSNFAAYRDMGLLDEVTVEELLLYVARRHGRFFGRSMAVVAAGSTALTGAGLLLRRAGQWLSGPRS